MNVPNTLRLIVISFVTKVKTSMVKTVYVNTMDQLADILIKGLSQAQHLHLLGKLGVLNILHPTA